MGVAISIVLMLINSTTGHVILIKKVQRRGEKKCR